MPKGYKTPGSAYVGHNPNYIESSGARNFPDEDAWLFAEGRRPNVEAWPNPHAEIRVLPAIPPVSLQESLAFVKINRRVCPTRCAWLEMRKYLILKGTLPWKAQYPAFTSPWESFSDSELHACLVAQLEYAASVGNLQLPSRYLRSLSEDEWLHENVRAI